MIVNSVTQAGGATYSHVCPICGRELASASEPGLLPAFSVCRCDRLPDGSPRFKLAPSESVPGQWVLSDAASLVVVRFEERKFNETQRVSFLDDETERRPDAAEIARSLRLMGQWAAACHGSVCFPQPHGIEISEEGGAMFLYRNKPPRWRLEMLDATDAVRLAASMNKAAAWLRSTARGYGDSDE